MRDLTTDTITVTACGMSEADDRELAITITNDLINTIDGEFYDTSYISEKLGKRVSMTTRDYPTHDEITRMITKSEKCERVEF